MIKGEKETLDKLEKANNVLLKIFNELHENHEEKDPKIRNKKFKEINSRAKIATKISNEAIKELKELGRRNKEAK